MGESKVFNVRMLKEDEIQRQGREGDETRRRDEKAGTPNGEHLGNYERGLSVSRPTLADNKLLSRNGLFLR